MPQTLNTLVIDDDDEDIFLIKKMLTTTSYDYDFRLLQAASIKEGLSLLNEVKIDVVLLDLTLPDSDGLEGLREIKNHFPSSTIVILTGRTDQEVGLDAMKNGAADFLIKNDLNQVSLIKTLIYSYERKRMEAHLSQAQKMETIGQLASGIAHDLNNQLTLMCLLTAKAESLYPKDSSFQKIISDFNSVIETCHYMTKQILSFSRIQNHNLTVIDVNETLNKMIPFINRLLGAGIVLDVELAENIPPVKVNKIQFEQAVWNLLINARDALQEKNQIILRTKLLSDNLTKPIVGIEVQDHGCGISAETKEDIFRPFFTTKPLGAGTGLGLAMVQRFSVSMGGKITCESEEGKGSRFLISLPACEEAASRDLAPSPSPSSNSPITVLVCDDEDLLRSLIVDTFKERGAKVIEAATGKQALEAFMRHQTEINLIITDLEMPGISGLELAQKVHEIKKDAKVLLISGLLEKLESMDCKENYVHYLPKPFSVPDLLNVSLNLVNSHSSAS